MFLFASIKNLRKKLNPNNKNFSYSQGQERKKKCKQFKKEEVAYSGIMVIVLIKENHNISIYFFYVNNIYIIIYFYK